MAKRAQKPGKGPATGRRQTTARPAKHAVKPAEDGWSDMDDSDSDDAWTELPVRERDSSRIRRQMEARRKLEQIREARRLSSLVDDWGFGEDWQLKEERS